MTLPNATINETDGALGIQSGGGRLMTAVGVSSRGPIDAPAAFAKVTDVVATYGEGPMVEFACYLISRYGKSVLITRTGQSVAGSFPADDVTVFAGTGTSVITVDDVGTAPNDDLDFAFRVVAGGTIGVAGITFQWSTDGGRTYSPITALGVAALFVFPESGGVQIDFAAGTLVAGDLCTFRGTAPSWNSAEINSALVALFATQAKWKIAHIIGPLDGTTFDVIDPLFSGGLANGKARSWIGHFRMEDEGETAAAYKAAADAALSSKATVFGCIAYGASKLSSAVTGRSFRRPSSFAFAAREISIEEHENSAKVNLGPLPGVSIVDANGNPDEHNEENTPGADESRFVTLRTWGDDFEGVYITRARLFSPSGSDYDLHTKRRVINIAHEVLRPYFIRRLHEDLVVDKKTGFIREEEAVEMERGAVSALQTALTSKPKASAVSVTISRTDALLTSKTISVSARITPLSQPEFIEIELGFINPALQSQTV